MISIIVPVYNCIDSLSGCVSAIVAQTHTDWELLLIDDGSTDGSGPLCDQIASEDPRIRVFHKANGGVSSARNLGLDHARGTYVMFCDSDDWPEPDWCEKLYREAECRPDGLPVCNYYRNGLSGEIINRPEQCGALPGVLPKAEFFHLNQQELLGIPWNKIFRNSILAENHIRFRPDISLGEDLIFNLDYLHYLAGGLIFVNTPLYHYSVGNGNSLSAKYYPNLSEIYGTIYLRIREEMDSIPDSWKRWQKEYYYSWFFAFDRVFRNTFSKKNPLSLFNKWRHNADLFHTREFGQCRRAIPRGYINTLQYIGLQTNCFSIYWITVIVSEAISAFLHHK